jgi:hypothetical protein
MFMVKVKGVLAGELDGAADVDVDGDGDVDVEGVSLLPHAASTRVLVNTRAVNRLNLFIRFFICS